MELKLKLKYCWKKKKRFAIVCVSISVNYYIEDGTITVTTYGKSFSLGMKE